MSAAEAFPISEADFQAQLVDLARVLGWKVMHVRKSIGKQNHWTTATSVIGWVDLLMWHESQQRVLFVEVKKESGRLTVEQAEVIRSLLAAGQSVYVWRPSDLERARDVLRGER